MSQPTATSPSLPPRATGPLTCISCLWTEGVERRNVIGAAVDPHTMLCLHCQPCPYCGRTGSACDETRGPRGCVPPDAQGSPLDTASMTNGGERRP